MSEAGRGANEPFERTILSLISFWSEVPLPACLFTPICLKMQAYSISHRCLRVPPFYNILGQEICEALYRFEGFKGDDDCAIVAHLLVADIQLKPWEVVWLALVPHIIGPRPPNAVVSSLGEGVGHFFTGVALAKPPYECRLASLDYSFAYEDSLFTSLAFSST